MSRLSDMLARRWSERLLYAQKRDWLLSLYDRALRRPLGKWLPGRGKSVAVHLKKNPEPLFVRLGSTDWLVLEEIFIKGEYDSLSRLKLTDVKQIVDLGANVGFSVRLWQQLYPGACVVAVEPDPDNVAAILRNCPASPQTIIVQACVANSARRVQIERSGGAWGIQMVDGKDRPGALDVQALPLTDILSSHESPAPSTCLSAISKELKRSCLADARRGSSG
jgi:FkbM family methyltransferase